jgi:hypothetical protein
LKRVPLAVKIIPYLFSIDDFDLSGCFKTKHLDKELLRDKSKAPKFLKK